MDTESMAKAEAAMRGTIADINARGDMEIAISGTADPGRPDVNAIGIPREKLRQSPGRPKGARNLNAKHPSSLAKRFKKAGLDWADALARAIQDAGNYEKTTAVRRQAREDVRMWLRLLPYMVTTTNKARVRRWKGKASKAAMIALDALEKE